MTFSRAMKNTQPLDVTPILGSGAFSPTSLKVKFKGSGSTSTGRPSAPVTKIPSGREGSSGGAGGVSFPKQPDSENDDTRMHMSKAFTRISISTTHLRKYLAP
jgi:hypothetical protein